MGEPPDSRGINPNYLPQISYDNSINLSISTPGPKFLVISRVLDIDQDLSAATLNNVSPFLIKKVIDSTCSGEVEFCKKTRNGTILVKTKNHIQANKLIKLRAFSPAIKVEVSEHKSLNSVKGVIYSNDLRGISNEEILHELKEQNVIKIDKILKKNVNNSELSETGLAILTFASTTLPEEICIGYERVKVRVFIPLPLKCNNCLRYGHIAKFCNNNKVCPDCSELYHINKENNESCTNIKACVNCLYENNNNVNHSSLDKSCPVFLKEKEIQAIITLNKVNRKTAIATYKSRHPYGFPSFASAVKSTNQEAHSSPSNNYDLETPKTSNRPIIDYSNIEDNTTDPAVTPTNNTQTKISIVPRRTSKRAKYELKRLAKSKKLNSTSLLQSMADSAATESDMS